MNHSSECSENSHVIVMDKEKILRTLAKRTLRTFSDHCCSEEDFLKSFRDDLPLYFTPSLDCLKGVAFRRILDDQSIVWQ